MRRLFLPATTRALTQRVLDRGNLEHIPSSTAPIPKSLNTEKPPTKSEKPDHEIHKPTPSSGESHVH
jgi:hypothetical protein